MQRIARKQKIVMTYLAAATAIGTVKAMLRVSFPPNPPPKTKELIQKDWSSTS